MFWSLLTLRASRLPVISAFSVWPRSCLCIATVHWQTEERIVFVGTVRQLSPAQSTHHDSCCRARQIAQLTVGSKADTPLQKIRLATTSALARPQTAGALAALGTCRSGRRSPSAQTTINLLPPSTSSCTIANILGGMFSRLTAKLTGHQSGAQMKLLSSTRRSIRWGT